jgi:flagellar hook assembly protein FlgD
LKQPSAVDLRIFTLTGEEVYSRYLPEGSAGTSEGENILEWDGRNDAGHPVLSGVYVVTIRAVKTGEQARLKVAVVR